MPPKMRTSLDVPLAAYGSVDRFPKRQFPWRFQSNNSQAARNVRYGTYVDSRLQPRGGWQAIGNFPYRVAALSLMAAPRLAPA